MNCVLLGASDQKREGVISELRRLRYFEAIRPMAAYAKLAGERFHVFGQDHSLIDDESLGALACTSILSLPHGLRFVLDGYPGTIGQSKLICEFVAAHQIKISGIFHFAETSEMQDVLVELKTLAPIYPLRSGLADKDTAELILNTLAF